MTDFLKEYSVMFIKAGVVPPPMGGAPGVAPGGAAPMPGGAPPGGGGIDALLGGLMGGGPGGPPGGAPGAPAGPGAAPGAPPDIAALLGGAPSPSAPEPPPPPPTNAEEAAAAPQDQAGRRVSNITLYAELVKIRKLLQGLYRQMQLPIPEDVLDDEEIVAPGAIARKTPPAAAQETAADEQAQPQPRLPGIGGAAPVTPIKPPK